MLEIAQTTDIQDEVLTFLLSAPTPQQVIEFHASEAAQARLAYLLDANREGLLTPKERDALEAASQLENFFTLLKAKAHSVLRST